jgi:hypothetical protein
MRVRLGRGGSWAAGCHDQAEGLCIGEVHGCDGIGIGSWGSRNLRMKEVMVEEEKLFEQVTASEPRHGECTGHACRPL